MNTPQFDDQAPSFDPINTDPHWATRPHTGRRATDAGAPRPLLDVPADWLLSMLDDVDVGLLLVNGSGEVLFINRSAEKALSHDAAGLWSATFGGGWQLLPQPAGLLDTVRATIAKGTRKLVPLGAEHGGGALAVLPFEAAPQAALVVLGRRQVCEPLSMQCFALAYGLTSTESQVLLLLSEGLRPADIAVRQGVELSTVRSQLSAIRAKTQTNSLGTLVRRIAVLPAIPSSLGRQRIARAHASH